MKKDPAVKGRRNPLEQPLTEQSNKSGDLSRLMQLKAMMTDAYSRAAAMPLTDLAVKKPGSVESFLRYRLRHIHKINPYEIACLMRSPETVMGLWDHVGMVKAASVLNAFIDARC